MMELEVKSKKETPLLSRTRVNASITYKGATPSLLDVKQKITSALKVKDNLVAVRHVYTKFGAEKAKVIAHVYEKHDDLMKMEDKKTLLKNKYVKTEEELKKEAEEKAKAEEAAKAAAAAAAPAAE
jgi:small subunit ribosomal protein S24e